MKSLKLFLGMIIILLNVDFLYSNQLIDISKNNINVKFNINYMNDNISNGKFINFALGSGETYQLKNIEVNQTNFSKIDLADMVYLAWKKDDTNIYLTNNVRPLQLAGGITYYIPYTLQDNTIINSINDLNTRESIYEKILLETVAANNIYRDLSDLYINHSESLGKKLEKLGYQGTTDEKIVQFLNDIKNKKNFTVTSGTLGVASIATSIANLNPISVVADISGIFESSSQYYNDVQTEKLRQQFYALIDKTSAYKESIEILKSNSGFINDPAYDQALLKIENILTSDVMINNLLVEFKKTYASIIAGSISAVWNSTFGIATTLNYFGYGITGFNYATGALGSLAITTGTFAVDTYFVYNDAKEWEKKQILSAHLINSLKHAYEIKKLNLTNKYKEYSELRILHKLLYTIAYNDQFDLNKVVDLDNSMIAITDWIFSASGGSDIKQLTQQRMSDYRTELVLSFPKEYFEKEILNYIKVPVINNKPIASFTLNKTSANIGDTITATSTSSDPDGDSLTYKWQLFKPDGTSSVISTSSTANFIGSLEGVYSLVLSVDDGINTPSMISYGVSVSKIYNLSDVVLPQQTIVGPISGSADSRKYYYIDVPSGVNFKKLTVWIYGSSKATAGPADLYISYNKNPTVTFSNPYDPLAPTVQYDYGNPSDNNEEVVDILNPKVGRYHILLYGFMNSYSNVNLFYQLTEGVSDQDNDRVPDNMDAFPTNPNEQYDSDHDGVGDNADKFPNDSSASVDSDGDHYPDNWNAGKTQIDSTTGLTIDKFPNDIAASVDNDGDLHPDVWNNGMTQVNSTTGLTLDLFKNDPSEWADSDGDGVGDNADVFKNDPTEWADSDGDGVGDNVDVAPNDPSRSTNTAPVINDINDTRVAIGKTLDIPIYANDSDGDIITFDIIPIDKNTSNPLSISGTTLHINGVGQVNSTQTFIIQAKDTFQASSSVLFTLSFYVGDQDQVSESNISLSTISLSFPTQQVGTTSSPLSFDIQNTGDTNLTLGSFEFNAPDYNITDNCNGNIVPSATCTVNITYTPSDVGSYTDNLMFTTNDPNNSNVVIDLHVNAINSANITNHPPIAIFNLNKSSATVGDIITATSTSTDEDNDTLVHTWLIYAPDGTHQEFSNQNSIAFTVDQEGSYTVHLNVFDGQLTDDIQNEISVNNTASNTIIYSEDFTSNPGFTSLSTTGKAQWNSSDGDYRVETRDDLNDKYFAYSPDFGLVDTTKPLFIQIDMLFENQNYGTYPGIRFYSDIPNEINDNMSLWIFNGNADNSRELIQIETIDQNGNAKEYVKSPQWSVKNNKWYRVTIQTNGNGKADINVVNRDTNEVILTENDTSFNISPFRYIGIGYYNQPDYGSDWSPIRVDNILIKKLDTNITQTLQLKQGWNLIGADFNLSNIVAPVSTVWQYKEGQWYAYSPDNAIKTKIQNTQSVKLIASDIESKNGTWLYTTQNSNMPLNNPSEGTYEYQLGWKLAGSSKDIPISSIKCTDGSLKSIWKYNSGRWLLKTDEVNNLNLSTFDTINKNEGFWVNCSQNEKTITSIEIIGASSIDETNTATYTAKANYSDGTSEVIQPIWNENSNYSTFSQDGMLSTVDVSSDTVVTLSISYDGYTATKDITIKDTTPKVYDYAGTWTGTHHVYLTQDPSIYCTWNITINANTNNTATVSAALTSHNGDQGECDSFSNAWGDLTNISDSGFRYDVTGTTSDYIMGPDYFNMTRSDNQISESENFTLFGYAAKRESTLTKN